MGSRQAHPQPHLAPAAAERRAGEERVPALLMGKLACGKYVHCMYVGQESRAVNGHPHLTPHLMLSGPCRDVPGGAPNYSVGC